MSRRSEILRFVVLGILSLHLYFLFSVVSVAAGNTLAGTPDWRDWYFIRAAGQRLLEGDWHDLYRFQNAGFWWRYPPPVLFLAALLALMDPWAAYWLTVCVAFASVAATLWLLFDAFRFDLPIHVTVAVFTSAGFSATVATGQGGALLTVLFAVALWGILKSHTVGPYAALGLLSLKPNWLPVVGIFTVAGRRLKGFGALVFMSAAISLTAIPLGIGFARAFFESALRNNQVLAEYPSFKSITLLTFFQETVGFGTAADLLWVASAVVLLGVGILAWRPSSPMPLARQFGLVVLVTVAVNPYVSFYDGLVLAVPAIVWWGLRGSYSTLVARRGIGAAVAFVWLWDQAVYHYGPGLESVGGLFGPPRLSLVPIAVTGWIFMEALDGLGVLKPGERAGGTAGALDDGIVGQEGS